MGRTGLVVALLLVLYTAVLGYGGTDPLVLSVVQIGVFLISVATCWQFHEEEVLTHPVLLAGFVLVAYVGLQWVFLTDSRATIQVHLLRWLAYICVFSMAFLLGQNRHRRQCLVLGLLALGFLESIYGLAQYLLAFPYVLVWRNVFYADRATGTYVNPNHFASLLGMILPLGLGVVLYAVDDFRKGRRESDTIWLDSRQVPQLAFYFFLSVVLFLGVLFSRSRMGIFSALVAVVAVVLLWGSASWHRAKVIPVLAVFLVGALTLGLWLGLEPVIVRYQAAEGAVLMRLALWKDAVALIEARPLLGTGLGTFADAYTQQQTSAFTRFVDHAHNDYLEFAAELGLLGALLLFGFVIWALVQLISAFYQSARQRDRFFLLGCVGSIVAILIHSLVDFSLRIPGNAVVFAAILGLGCAASGAAIKEKVHHKEESIEG